jgi:hypothetical protein
MYEYAQCVFSLPASLVELTANSGMNSRTKRIGNVTQRELTEFSITVIYGRMKQKQVSFARVTHSRISANLTRNYFTYKETAIHFRETS